MHSKNRGIIRAERDDNGTGYHCGLNSKPKAQIKKQGRLSRFYGVQSLAN